MTQYLNASDANPEHHRCSPCPMGGSCIGDITWKNVTAKYGWWRRRDYSETTETPPSCLAHQTISNPSCVFHKCHNPHACFGAANPGQFTNALGKDPAKIDRPESCNVEDGYEQWCSEKDYGGNSSRVRCRLCATCQIGYKRKGSGTACQLCPEETTNRTLLGVGIVLMFIGLTIMTYTSRFILFL